MGKLVATLNKMSVDTVGDDQGRWRQFILDHLDYIAARSRTYEVADVDVTAYAYDLRRYLSQSLGRRGDIGWIVQLLNDLPNDLVFDQPGTYVVPSDDLINKLYLTYKTINANQKVK